MVKTTKKFIIAIVAILMALETFLPSFALATTNSTVGVNAASGPEGLEDKTTASLINLADSLNSLKDYLMIDSRKLGLDAYDYSQLKKYLTVYKELEATNTISEYEKTGQIPPEIAQETGASNLQTYDKRTVKAIINLVTPKYRGGAGHEWIKVASLTRGYTSERKATSREAEKELAERSAHNTGQAVDITQIDFLRGTKFIYEDDELKEKSKLPKIPIGVAWQAQEGGVGDGSIPEILGKSMHGLFANLGHGVLQNAILDWLSQRGMNINLGTLKGGNSGQLLQELGLAWIKDAYLLPDSFNELGYDLESTGLKLGQSILSETFNQQLPATAFHGQNLEEFIINVGREWLNRQAGFPANSLKGKNSSEVIEDLAKRKMEEEFDLPTGTLNNISNKDELNNKVGQAAIEKVFKLRPESFRGNSLEEVKQNIGETAYQDIFNNVTFSNRLLGLSQNSINSLDDKNNFAINIKSIKTELTAVYLNNIAGIYYNGGQDSYKSPKLDEVMNLASGQMQNILDGNPDWQEIGRQLLAKYLVVEEGINNNTKEDIKSWLRLGIIPKNPLTQKEGIDEESLAAQWGLKRNDLWRIFIQNRPKEVFYRLGLVHLLGALTTGNANGSLYSQAPISDDLPSNFGSAEQVVGQLAKDKIEELKTQMNLVPDQSDKQNIADCIGQIENYATSKPAEVLLKDNFVKDTVNEIQAKSANLSGVMDIQKRKIRDIINELIEGYTIKDAASLKKEDVSGLSAVPVASQKDFREEMVKVLQGQQSIEKLTIDLGLTEWANIFELDDDTTLTNINESIGLGANPSDAINNRVSDKNIENFQKQINDQLNAVAYSSDKYNLDKNEVKKLMLGQGSSVLNKIGGLVANEALGFLPGKGLKEYNEGTTDWSSIERGAGLRRLWEFLGLSGEPEDAGDQWSNLKRAYLEEFLGLKKGSFSADFQTMIQANNYTYHKIGVGGLARALTAFGINIPEEIRQIDNWPATTETQLGNFFNAIKDPNNQFWSEADNLNRIDNAVSGLKMNSQQVKKLITGQSTDILNSIDAKIKEEITKTDQSGEFYLNDYFNFYETYATDKNDQDFVLENFKLTPDQINQLGQGVLGVLHDLVKKDLNAKTGFGFDGAVGLPDILSNGAMAKRWLEENGISTLSNLFNSSKKNVLEGFWENLDTPIANTASGRNIFSLIYRDGLEKIRVADHILFTPIFSDISLADKNTFGEIINIIKNFTAIDVDIEALKFTTGDLKGGLTSWGMAQLKDQYKKWVQDWGAQWGVGVNELNFDTLKTAYFEPDSGDWSNYAQQAGSWCDQTPSCRDESDLITKDKLIAQQTFVIEKGERERARKDVQYSLLDMSINKSLGQNAPGPGFAQIMLEGNQLDKMNFLVGYLGRLGIKGVGSIGEILGDNAELLKCFTGQCDGNALDWIMNNPQAAAVMSNLENQLRTMTGWDFLPDGFLRSTIDFIKGDQTAISKLLDQKNVQFMITNWLDKTMGLPLGASYQIWQTYQGYQEALQGYQTILNSGASTLGQIQQAQNILQLKSAQAANLIIQMVLGKTFAQLDQQLGLPPGTSSLIVGAVVYSLIAGVSFGAAVTSLLGGPIGIAIFVIGAIFGFGKQKTTRVEIIYTAGGYYPDYTGERDEVNRLKQEAQKTNNPADWQKFWAKEEEYDVVPTDEIDQGDPGEFHAENNSLFSAGALKAARWKVKTALEQLMQLPERMGDENMLPRQIVTMRQEDIASLSSLIDKVYGDGTPGSALQRLQSGMYRIGAWSDSPDLPFHRAFIHAGW